MYDNIFGYIIQDIKNIVFGITKVKALLALVTSYLKLN